MERNPSGSFLSDFFDSFVSVSCEQISNGGEDSVAFSANENAAMCAVFDGCGGAGGQHYPELSDKSGAFIAARAASAAALEWFHGVSGGRLEESLTEFLSFCKKYASDTGITLKGDLLLDFPSTCAMATCRPEKDGLRLSYRWAGDSRGYLLDKNGLAQMTRDDSTAETDGYNLTGDGRLTNVISLTESRPWVMHRFDLTRNRAFAAITATDGCFSYMRSPMDFEYLLLDTLLASDSPKDWERRLFEEIGRYAQDDYTLCAMVFGYGEFENLKNAMKPRHKFMAENYISKLENANADQIAALWNSYKQDYIKY